MSDLLGYPFDHLALTDEDKAELLEWVTPYSRRHVTASGLADLHQLVGRIVQRHALHPLGENHQS